MHRRYAVLIATVLLLTACMPLSIATPTAVVRPTERPAYTPVPTFTPTTELPSPVSAAPTAQPTASPAPTLSPSATPTSAPTAPAPATSTAVPTASATKAPTRAATRAPTRPPATPKPAPTAAPASGPWHGEYFSNPDLSGTPVLVRNEADVNFDWGMGSPDPSVPTDHFSARWTRSVSLSEGRWRFHATADDGVRVYVDGLPIIDQWHTTGAVTYNTSAALSGGVHLLRVDYYDNVENALVHVWWEPDDGSATDPAHTGSWRGDYYDNRDLSGDPVFSRDDPAVYFDWGDAGPGGGIAGTEFSVRWMRQAFIPGGRYLFKVKADDGVRVWLDWKAIIDEWHDSPANTTYEKEIQISNGIHPLVVEYYQGAGSAQVEVSWQPTNADWLGNIHTCLLPQNGYVKVYRLGQNDQWEDLNPGGYTANSAEATMTIFGVPIDANFGWDGQPYRVEVWAGSTLLASDGNIFAGQPAFRIMPGQDVETTWSCVGGTVTK